MIDDLLAFAVQHLTIFDAGLAVLILTGLLVRRRHATVVWWTVSMGLMLGLSFLLSRVAGLLYQDPRTHTAVHLKPLAPLLPFMPHLAHNSFPSSHAVFAAGLVSAVLLLSRRWAMPLIVLGVLDTWVRMGLGLHQAVDVAGGWIIVTLATVVALYGGAVLAAILLPAIPPRWTAERIRLRVGHSTLRLT